MIPTLINGQWELNLPEHRAARPEWSRPEGWERERLNAMHHATQPGDTIIDVGAEEGDMSALLAQWAGPTGGIVLVEPNPKVWPNVKAIFESNPNLAPVVEWFVGFAAAETDLYPINDNVTDVSWTTGGWPACSYGPVIGNHGFRHLAEEADATPAITLDDLVDRAALARDIDLITMDVEGSELEVVKGATELLTQHRPAVFISVHPEFMRVLYGQHPDELHTWMAALGYTGELLAEDHEFHFRYLPN